MQVVKFNGQYALQKDGQVHGTTYPTLLKAQHAKDRMERGLIHFKPYHYPVQDLDKKKGNL